MLKLLSVSLSKEALRLEFEPMEITMLLIVAHCCAETGKSICDFRPGTSEDSMNLMEFGFSSDSYYFCLFLVKLVHLERRKPF